MIHETSKPVYKLDVQWITKAKLGCAWETLGISYMLLKENREYINIYIYIMNTRVSESLPPFTTGE